MRRPMRCGHALVIRHNDSMSTVRWRLADFLDERGISTYALIQAIGSTRMNTIYRLTRRGQEPSRVDFHTLATVLDGLSKLTGQPVGI